MTFSRRNFLRGLMLGSSTYGLGLAALGAVGMSSAGCIAQPRGSRTPDVVWGRRGLSDGRLLKPRAVTISPQDELYIVDMTGRIQVFRADHEGYEFLRGWRTPEIKQGKPTGLGWSLEGQLLVADTHYFRVLFYNPDGTRDTSRAIGGEHGDEPGQFHFVTDVVQDARGHFFVGQYGQVDQIQEFDADCRFIRRWGSQGEGLGEFSRPQALLMDDDGLLWVADACNHRIQVFDVSAEPKLVHHWGTPGSLPGQLKYPYGLDFDTDGTLWVSEFGNHRVQHFTREGESLGYWGSAGQEPGQFYDPWALILDSQRNLHVLDSKNHRLQRFELS